MIGHTGSMTHSVYASHLICEAPRVWYLALGTGITLEQSAALIRNLARQLSRPVVSGLIIDYRAASLRRLTNEYAELALSISVNAPPGFRISYITNRRNRRYAALMVDLLRERAVDARDFSHWSELLSWQGCDGSIEDPLPDDPEDSVVLI